MRNYQKEILKCVFSLVGIFIFGLLILNFNSLDTLEKFCVCIFYTYLGYFFIFSLNYLFKFFTYKDIALISDYEIENIKKYNKMGEYFKNRVIVKYKDKIIKSNWSIDFKEKTKEKMFVECKTNGSCVIIV